MPKPFLSRAPYLLGSIPTQTISARACSTSLVRITPEFACVTAVNIPENQTQPEFQSGRPT